MNNKKVFVGNLNFEVSEQELKELLLQYGTINEIKLYQKKGYAFAEFETPQEAENAVEKLEGVILLNREIHISMALRPRKAKSMTVKKFTARGEVFAGKKKSGSSERPTGHYSQRGNSERPSGPGSDFKYGKKKFSREDRPVRESSERKPDSDRSEKRVWTPEKPSYVKSSKPGFNYKSKEKFSSNAGNDKKEHTGESRKSDNSEKRAWTNDKPSRPGRPSRDGEKSSFRDRQQREGGKSSSEKSSKPWGGAKKSYPPKSSVSSDSDKEKWQSEKPAGTYRPRTGGNSTGLRKRIIRTKKD